MACAHLGQGHIVERTGTRTGRVPRTPASATSKCSTTWQASPTAAVRQSLADAVHLSQSALSRLADRLERHGLVQRSNCVDDRRGINLVLTAAGRDKHGQALRTYCEVLASDTATRASRALRMTSRHPERSRVPVVPVGPAGDGPLTRPFLFQVPGRPARRAGWARPSSG